MLHVASLILRMLTSCGLLAAVGIAFYAIRNRSDEAYRRGYDDGQEDRKHRIDLRRPRKRPHTQPCA